MAQLQKVRACLWFDTEAEAALTLYSSLFDDGAVDVVNRHGPENKVLTVTATFGGQQVIGLNGGPHFPQTEAFSFSVTCKDQAEVDHLWQSLLADGGKESQCGWLKDRFGVSWQIIPQRFFDLMSHPDEAARTRVFQATMKMVKFDIAALERAADSAKEADHD